MQYKKLYSVLLLVILAYGCGNSSADEKSEAKTDSLTAPVTGNPVIPASTASPADTTPKTPTTGINGQGITIQPSVPSANTTGSGLNPEHGKPGHRCDIAVGAPLNSKPSADYTPPAVTTTTKPATTTSPVSITPTAPAANTATTTVAPGMNPAHGQPGHRCDIAVGAPLNSKPAATTPVTTQPGTVLPQPTPVVTPAAPASASTTVAPGMNPAHGQPGHRCDIAVGAPLNSAPKKN